MENHRETSKFTFLNLDMHGGLLHEMCLEETVKTILSLDEKTSTIYPWTIIILKIEKELREVTLTGKINLVQLHNLSGNGTTRKNTTCLKCSMTTVNFMQENSQRKKIQRQCDQLESPYRDVRERKFQAKYSS